MKQLLGVLLIAVFGTGFLFAANASAADTSNFSISSFDIQYELSRDSEGRSVLKTTETITAKFPAYDQNHGLERAIPTSYDGHPVALTIEEVTNTNGDNSHSVTDSGGVKLLRIGSADEYVHGEQTYRIVYSQRDVTRFYKDTGRDEWYWDTNGTQWRVPIDTLTVSVKLSPDLISTQTGDPYCYFGAEGSSDLCMLKRNEDGAYSTEMTSLQAGQNISVAFGFKQGTFTAYSMSMWEILAIIWTVSQFLSIPLAIIFTVAMSIFYYRKSNRTKEVNPIVTEYIPPRDTSVMVASQVVGATNGSAFTAQLIDLAVRHYVSIVETKEKSFWKSAEYDIVVSSDLSSLLEEEKEIISDMFGHLPTVGERLALKSLISDTSYRIRTMDNTAKVTKLIESSYALRHKVPEASKVFYRWATALLVIGILTLSIPIAFAAGITALLGASLKPLTDKGLAMRRYILGLDRYIKTSEAERLKFLQGPDTAQKIGYTVDTDNPGQLVKLYERVLPYAILFGREKDWATRLGNFYQTSNTSPDWYTGTTAFNAAVFASTMSSISTASSYSGGSNSGSGGSSGGGSSGGGGGGGGGGGW